MSQPANLLVRGWLLLACVSVLNASTYSYTDLRVPGAPSTTLRDINNSGMVVGTYGASLFPTSGFVWSGQSGFTLFDVPDVNPTFGTEAYSLNDAGVVVGSVFPGCCSSSRSGFIRETDGATRLLPGMSLVRGINNAGSIAGVATSPVIQHPDGTSTDVQVPGAYVILEDINNLGDVVGYNDTSGFIRQSDGSLTFLNVPGALFTVATGLNDRDEVVGFYRDQQIRHRGFYWSVSTGFRFLDHPETTGDTLLYGINNAGTLVGSYRTPGSFNEAGFIAASTATAVPEPGSAVVIFSGLTALCIARSVRARAVGSGRR
ncbi:MAG TPA: hypothetical protein VES20_19770 [Bryobacteraceae bacterium]|nr:hypothetical protein [Bryobacteraceae bacterium]